MKPRIFGKNLSVGVGVGRDRYRPETDFFLFQRTGKTNQDTATEIETELKKSIFGFFRRNYDDCSDLVNLCRRRGPYYKTTGSVIAVLFKS